MSKFTNGLAQDGNKWIARTTTIRDGQRKVAKKTFYLGTSEQNEQAARDWLHNQERIRSGLSPFFSVPTNLDELVNYYLESVRSRVKSVTHDGYNRLLSQPLKHFGQTHSLFFNQYEIDEYCKLRQIEGAGRTIIKELNALRYALNECHIQCEWIVPRHLSRLPKQEAYVPNCTDFRKLTDSLGQESRLAVLMAVFAGLRNDEVYRVGWDCYSQSESLLSIPASIRKTNIGNVVPVVNTLEKGLSSTGSVCSTATTGTIISISKSEIANELRKASRRAGIHVWTGLQPARRLLCATAESAGYASEQISLITGHKRTSMVSRYSHGAEQLELKRKILEDVERRLIA